MAGKFGLTLHESTVMTLSLSGHFDGNNPYQACVVQCYNLILEYVIHLFRSTIETAERLLYMRKNLTILFLLIPLVSSSEEDSYDERFAEIAAYVNAVWYAEEYNELCPGLAITVPMSEEELREILMALDGEDTLEKAARDPNRPEVSFRDGMKDLARESIERGCDSQLAASMRSRIEENLVVPDAVNELKFSGDGTEALQ